MAKIDIDITSEMSPEKIKEAMRIDEIIYESITIYYLRKMFGKKEIYTPEEIEQASKKVWRTYTPEEIEKLKARANYHPEPVEPVIPATTEEQP